ncbi:hypothetical protein Tco_0617561 [Tanacetum coccineum]
MNKAGAQVEARVNDHHVRSSQEAFMMEVRAARMLNMKQRNLVLSNRTERMRYRRDQSMVSDPILALLGYDFCSEFKHYSSSPFQVHYESDKWDNISDLQKEIVYILEILPYRLLGLVKRLMLVQYYNMNVRMWIAKFENPTKVYDASPYP